jgi:hypothetical protein
MVTIFWNNDLATRMKTAALCFITAALFLASSLPAIPSRSLAQGETTIGIDASSQGNAATSLGTIDSCISVATDHTFEVDVYVENVTDLLAWEAYVTYDHAIVQIIDRDVELFQAGAGTAVVNVSDSVPFDADRPFRIGATNMSEPPAGESGSGVLARLTLKAIASGDTPISIEPVDLNKDGQLKSAEDIGPYLKDSAADLIGDADGNIFFDGPIVAAEIAVDEVCGADGPDVPDSNDDGGGWRWWMTALIVAGAAVVLVAGMYLLRRGRRGDVA